MLKKIRFILFINKCFVNMYVYVSCVHLVPALGSEGGFRSSGTGCEPLCAC